MAEVNSYSETYYQIGVVLIIDGQLISHMTYHIFFLFFLFSFSIHPIYVWLEENGGKEKVWIYFYKILLFDSIFRKKIKET